MKSWTKSHMKQALNTSIRNEVTIFRAGPNRVQGSLLRTGASLQTITIKPVMSMLVRERKVLF
jgi:hypothetical protein